MRLKKITRIYAVIYTMALCILSLEIFAQNADVPTPEPFDPSVFWATVGKYAVILLSIYDIVARLMPTLRSYSISANFFALLNYLFPDKKVLYGKVVGTHERTRQSITIASIKAGDRVKIANGTILKVIDVGANSVIGSTKAGDLKDVPLSDIIEIIEKGYIVVEIVQWFVGLFKKWFGKKTPAIN